MNAKPQPQLRFHGVEFPYINFNSHKRLDAEAEIEIEVMPKVFFPKAEPTIFKIVQDIKVFTKEQFELSIVGIGTFEISKDIDQELKDKFIQLNAPAIMFPYLRSFISTLTSNLGNVTGTLTIPPQFFSGTVEETKNLKNFKDATE